MRGAIIMSLNLGRVGRGKNGEVKIRQGKVRLWKLEKDVLYCRRGSR